MGITFGKQFHFSGPSDDRENEIFRNICSETRTDCLNLYGFSVDNDWHIYHIADKTIKGIIEALMIDVMQSGEPGRAKKASFNFFDMFLIYVSNRKSTGEKEGNYNVAFEVGPKGEELIGTDLKKSDIPDKKVSLYDFFKIEYPDPVIEAQINHTYLMISRKICQTMSTKMNLVITDEVSYIVYAVTYQFVMNIYRKLLYMIGEDPTTSLVSLNFNDLIEFHAQRSFTAAPETGEAVEEGVVLLMRPGVDAKIGIKNDESTEQEYEDC